MSDGCSKQFSSCRKGKTFNTHANYFTVALFFHKLMRHHLSSYSLSATELVRKYLQFSSSFQSSVEQVSSHSPPFFLLHPFHLRFVSSFSFPKPVFPWAVAYISGSEPVTELLRTKPVAVLLLSLWYRGGMCWSVSGKVEAESIRCLPLISFLRNLGVNSPTKLDCRCNMCSRFLRSNLSSEVLSFWSCRVSLTSVAASTAFRTSKVFALFFDKRSSSLLGFIFALIPEINWDVDSFESS